MNSLGTNPTIVALSATRLGRARSVHDRGRRSRKRSRFETRARPRPLFGLSVDRDARGDQCAADRSAGVGCRSTSGRRGSRPIPIQGCTENLHDGQARGQHPLPRPQRTGRVRDRRQLRTSSSLHEDRGMVRRRLTWPGVPPSSKWMGRPMALNQDQLDSARHGDARLATARGVALHRSRTRPSERSPTGSSSTAHLVPIEGVAGGYMPSEELAKAMIINTAQQTEQREGQLRPCDVDYSDRPAAVTGMARYVNGEPSGSASSSATFPASPNFSTSQKSPHL